MPRKTNPRLTEAEAKIIDGIWTAGSKSEHDPRLGVTIREVHEHLYPKGEMSLTTTQTVVERLVRKGFLKAEMVGRVKFFTPTLSRKELIRTEFRRLKELYCQGSFAKMREVLDEMEKRETLPTRE